MVTTTAKLTTLQEWPDFQTNPQAEPFRKIFVGGLDKKTTEESLKEYFDTNYGDVVNCEIKNQGQGRKGFGFITFAKSDKVDEVQKKRPHYVDEKAVETKRATPKSQEYWATKKLYIKDFDKEKEEEDLKKELRDFFSQYGEITEIKIVRDKDTKAYKGYGFIDFSDEDPVDRFNLMKKVKVGDTLIKVAKAYPKDYGYNRGAPNYYYDDYYMPPPQWYGNPRYGGPWQQQRWDRGGYPMYGGMRGGYPRQGGGGRGGRKN